MNDKDFIKEFKKISIKTICKEKNVNYYNIMCGRAGYEATRKVSKELATQLCDLLNKRKEFMAVDFDENSSNSK